MNLAVDVISDVVYSHQSSIRRYFDQDALVAGVDEQDDRIASYPAATRLLLPNPMDVGSTS